MDKKFFKASDEMSHFHKEQEMKKYFICNDCDRAFPIEKYFGCPECGRKSDYIKQLSENEDIEIISHPAVYDPTDFKGIPKL